MVKVTLALDLDVVKQAIDLKVASAVEEFLGCQYDIKTMIMDELKKPAKPKYQPMFMGRRETPDETPLIESLIVMAITSSAVEYTRGVIQKHSHVMDELFQDALIEKIGKLKFNVDVSTELVDDGEGDS